MKLISYKEIEAEIKNGRTHLLLGNGFSISCNKIFSYRSLFENAKNKGLSKNAINVFNVLGTNNFEGVLRILDDTYWISNVYYKLADKGKVIIDDIEVIKNTLIETLAESHLEHSGMITDKSKSCALQFLQPYHNIFTTNYDLLLYWVVMYDKKTKFGDGFRAEYENPDSDSVVFTEHIGGKPGILFLHGALHIFMDGGELRKHCWYRTQTPLIELIRKGLSVKRYPLFVAEGTFDKKLEQIHKNPYLSYCLGKLDRIENRLVIFGHTLGISDKHIANTIARNDKLKELYVGIFKDPQSRVAKETIAMCKYITSQRKNLINPSSNIQPLKIIYYDSSTVNIWNN
jgi:hypothetical protein